MWGAGVEEMRWTEGVQEARRAGAGTLAAVPCGCISVTVSNSIGEFAKCSLC